MIKKLVYNDDGSARPAAAGSLVAVVVLLAGWFVYSAWAGMGGQLDSKLLCITEDCGYSDSRKLQVGESFPATCPRCGNRSVYPALKCPQCGKPHVPPVMLGKSGSTTCFQCGTEIRRVD